MTERLDEGVLAWLHLLRHAGSGVRLRKLLDVFGRPAAILAASRSELLPYFDDDPAVVGPLRAGPDADSFEHERAWLGEKGNHIVALDSPDYPSLLREIADAPPLLYVRGNPALLASPQLAVVGSRNPSRAGCENARAFSHHLVQAGLSITSGMALGIDACAHQAALDAGGHTLAVTGTGLDRVYPAAHRDLAHAIADHGALVSEFPLGTPPRRENFPRRNRLISGLSLGVLVVEAAPQSGSLITARLAGEQGREVFAIPGSIHSPLARGCHALIRQGAKLVEGAQDILEELGALARTVAQSQSSGTAMSPLSLTEDESRLLELIGHDPVELDVLVAQSGLTAAAVSSMLLTMELRGFVEARPGGRVQRTS